MRDILFRGKRTDNGEWVYGDLVHVENKSYISYYYESPLSTFINEQIEYINMSMVGVAPFIEVDLTAIGQFTGLTDKNGKKIFEGDIVKFPHGTKSMNGKIEYIEEDCIYYLTYKTGRVPFGVFFNGFELEIIGNIHDNPELLEEKE